MSPSISVISLGVVFFINAAGWSVAQDSGGATKVVGVSVTLPDPDSEYGGAFVLGRQPGVEVHLLFENKQAFLISVVDEGPDKTELKLAVGDKELERREEFSRVGFMSNISEDGHRVVVPVVATEIPAADCTRLSLKGQLALMVGSDAKTEKIPLEFKVDETLKWGSIELKIASVEEQNFGEPATAVAFESQQALDVVQSVTFLDRDGNQVPTSSGGSSSFGFGEQVTYSRSYQWSGDTKPAAVEVVYFSKTELLKIPVKHEFGLGITPSK